MGAPRHLPRPSRPLPVPVRCHRVGTLGPLERPGRSAVLHAWGDPHRSAADLVERDARVDAAAATLLARPGGYNSAKPIVVSVRDHGSWLSVCWVEGTFADLVVAGEDAAAAVAASGGYPQSPLYVTGCYVGVQLRAADGRLWCHRRSGVVHAAQGVWAPGPCEGIDAPEVPRAGGLLDLGRIAVRGCVEEAAVGAQDISSVRPLAGTVSAGAEGTVVAFAVEVATTLDAATLADRSGMAADGWEADRYEALLAPDVAAAATGTHADGRTWLPLVQAVPPAR